MATAQPNTQVLLAGWKVGEDGARDRLITALHGHIADIAAARLRRENGSSLSTEDLVNEAILRLMRTDPSPLTDRAHILALASRMMRHILVDHARQKHSIKRQHVRVELCTRIDGEQRLDLTALETALIRLGAIDPGLMEVVEMRYFGGMSLTDVSAVTGLSEATMKRRWQVARAWLADALDRPIDDE